MNSYAQIKVEDQAAAARSDHRFPSAPSSDSGCTTSSDWSQYNSPAQSPALLPLSHVRLARSVRGTERQRTKDEHDPLAASAFSSHYRSSIRPPSPPTPSPTSPSKSRRIPRPPNAFILYRSDLLKNGGIPDSIERRQQTLSRVAGQCWNLLSVAEKRKWQDLAAERAAIHQLEYPDYHFKPSPRGKGKAKLHSNEEKTDDAIRVLRETYLGIRGPSICTSRQKKPKSEEIQPNGETPGPYQSAPSSLILPSVSPCDAQDLGTFSWTSFSNSPSPSLSSPEPASDEPALPPCFPQRTFPHFAAPRRPSTSLGFVRRLEDDASCFQPGYSLERPASAASDTGLTNLVRDLDLTPTVANFGHISMPSTPSDFAAPYSTGDHVIRSPFPFASLNAPLATSFPDPESNMGDAELSMNFDARFMMPLDDSYGFPSESNVPFSFDDWNFDTISQSMGAGDQ
ncbi:hypothetical protein C8R44DRAFT_872971 [Mycena epipterygia]|nr:hypothetical protein C8R44DRAFT_872971 [Mycena epipterygia]